MKNYLGGMLIVASLMTLAGCQQPGPAVGHDGRPHPPSDQSVPGGLQGKGPVGQPQS